MKTIKNIAISALTIFAAAVFVTVLMHALFYSSQSDLTVPLANAAMLKDDYPVSLYIPAIKVNAKAQQVGVTRSGQMAVPNNFTDVGWYKYGTEPGQIGSAVIAGHVDDGLSFPGVFVNLDQLKKGDDIYVTMHDGNVLHFVMIDSQAYTTTANTDAIFNDDNGRFLRLITCTGTWLPLQRTHNERLVVTAVLKN